MGRAFVVVADACGAGALPDAADYGDEGTNTLAHLAEIAGGLKVPALGALGLGSILPLRGVGEAEAPAIHGRLAAQGFGKDSTAGHWELMGVVAGTPPPSYPDGFPDELVAELERITGHETIGNRPCNGVVAIQQWGDEHLRTSALILYTSQDSVLQLAAHVDRVAPERLYAACGAVREAMVGEHAVGRVIARPFEGPPGQFVRTLGRRDYALPPPAPSYLDVLRDAGQEVHGVGKVVDLFAGHGFTRHHHGEKNTIAIESTDRLLAELDEGLVFVNLIETDQVYGHRKDAEGFHRALREIDAAVARWVDVLGPDDLLVITADHGCDIAAEHSDHTREYAPLLATTGAGTDGHRHDGALADVGATVTRWLGVPADGLPGAAFL